VAATLGGLLAAGGRLEGETEVFRQVVRAGDIERRTLR
jgi:hypothetical protein